MSLKDIWNNIINFDLTLLGSEAVVIPVTIVATFIAYYFIGVFTDDDFFIKRWEKKYSDLIDSMIGKWYLAPIKWLLMVLYMILFLYILLLPVSIVYIFIL